MRLMYEGPVVQQTGYEGDKYGGMGGEYYGNRGHYYDGAEDRFSCKFSGGIHYGAILLMVAVDPWGYGYNGGY
jgi:hypothetical protein